MRTHSLKTRALVICLGLCLGAAAGAFAGGQGEPRLSDAEKLIQQQDYAGALKLLAAIQRSDPTLRDETTRLMGQVMAVMQRYNNALEEMNLAIEAGDAAKIEALIPELRRIDPTRAAGVTSQAGTLVGFLKVMKDAQALLQDNRPADALALYLLVLTDPAKVGVKLPRAEFESAGYGDIITKSVERTTAGIVSAAQSQLRAPTAISSSTTALAAVLDRPGPDSAARFDAAAAPLIAAAKAEGTVRAAAASISEINRTVQSGSEKGREDPYLRYLAWLCLGRGATPEGIAHAIRVMWVDTAWQTAEASERALRTGFDSARSRYSSGALAEADAELQILPARCLLAAKSVSLASAQFDVADPGRLPQSEPRAKALLAMGLAAGEDAAEAAAYRVLISARAELSSLPAAAAATPAQLSAGRVTLAARMEDVQSRRQAWSATALSWESASAVTDTAAPLADSARRLSEAFSAVVENDLQTLDTQYALRVASLAGAGFPARLNDATTQRARAEDLMGGTMNGQAPSPGALVQRRPDQALAVLGSTGTSLDSLISDIQGLEQKLDGERDYIKANAGFGVLFAGTAGQPGFDGLLQTARAEKSRVDNLSASAEKQIQDAAVASREGDNNFAQAQAAVTRGDPDGASSALELATGAYLRSLASAYSEHAVTRTTKDVDDLNARILGLQNTISIANAQKAMVAISKLIVVKDFLGASDALDAAVRAWNQTQEGTYPPFDNLRQTIQAAVELSQGREISRLDPKAEVVNAFIKNAQDNLSEGRLTDAMQNVRDALAVAPNYGAAKVLQLLIKKQTDPAGFERDASAQIATYMKMSTDRTDVQGQKTAYLALLDYSKLDPRFAAETRGTIQELEYTLGLARRPPTAQQIARSNELLQRANATQQQGTQEAYQRALDLLKQALQVNPDNTDAVRLDGLIRNRMGSTALAALSTADTQTYNQAYSLFLSGAYQDAYDRVLQLWNDPRTPRNKTYGPLQRLKKRLEVQLNIS